MVEHKFITNGEMTISSLEIAQIVGKEHKHLLRDIRVMEDAWEKVAGSKFGLGQYKDKNGQLRPCYYLTKTECLYIATKFNDEARAKLVLRWEELEREKYESKQNLDVQMLQTLEQTQAVMKLMGHKYQIALDAIDTLVPKAEYCEQVLEVANCLTTQQVAKDLGMSAIGLNQLLHEMKVQYKQGETWMLYADWQNFGLTDYRTHYIEPCDRAKQRMVWTQKGRAWIINMVEKGMTPREALKALDPLVQKVALVGLVPAPANQMVLAFD